LGDELVVECHSGFTYAQRPTVIHWQGRRLEIEQVEAEWRVTEGRRFRVRTHDSQVIELVYLEEQDEWRIV
jgi:hypothetical protein